MGCLSWIVLGLIVGGLARFVVPGKDPMGCITTLLLGILGSAAGGYVGSMLGFGTIQGFDLRSLGLALAGAIVLLLIWRALRSDEVEE